MRRLRLAPLALLLAAAAPPGPAGWKPYRLRGVPFDVSIPPGAVVRRRGPPGSAESGRYALREERDDGMLREGIVIPLRHGLLSAYVYRSPSVYDSIAHYRASRPAGEPWGHDEAGTWEGLPTYTSGWVSKALDGTRLVSVDYVVEAAEGETLILSLQADADAVDSETPYLVRFKESLRRRG